MRTTTALPTTAGTATPRAATRSTRCAACGTPATSQPPPYTWSVSIGHTGRTWTCAPCARTHLPRIERRELPVG